MNSNKNVGNTTFTKVELPTAVHEEVRQEKVTEVQPIINIEKQRTEVIQKTQPIFDKEIKNVNIVEKTLNTEILPEVVLKNGQQARARDVSTVETLATKSVQLEKPAIFNETIKTNVIEEIQPVIYKETVVPSVVKETQPVYQKIVEGAQYSSQVLPEKNLGVKGTAYVPDQTVAKGVNTSVQLPTQVRELPTAVHEQIRQEKVEEIQPVINVEKVRTEVHQKTQPILDKEIKAVAIEQKTLPTQVLPQVNIASKTVSMQRDQSTTMYQDKQAMVIEKAPVFNEVDKLQVIEEIQPVIYKETVVPEVLKTTQPVYQKIVEGTTYSSEVLPPIQLHGTHAVTQTFVQPTIQQQTIPRAVDLPAKKEWSAPKTEKLVEEKTTQVTTVTEPVWSK